MSDHVDGLKKPCPRCGCEASKIEYRNTGPFVYLMCPDCRFRLDDQKIWGKGYMGRDGLVKYWNEETI